MSNFGIKYSYPKVITYSKLDCSGRMKSSINYSSCFDRHIMLFDGEDNNNGDDAVSEQPSSNIRVNGQVIFGNLDTSQIIDYQDPVLEQSWIQSLSQILSIGHLYFSDASFDSPKLNIQSNFLSLFSNYETVEAFFIIEAPKQYLQQQFGFSVSEIADNIDAALKANNGVQLLSSFSNALTLNGASSSLILAFSNATIQSTSVSSSSKTSSSKSKSNFIMPIVFPVVFGFVLVVFGIYKTHARLARRCRMRMVNPELSGSKGENNVQMTNAAFGPYSSTIPPVNAMSSPTAYVTDSPYPNNGYPTSTLPLTYSIESPYNGQFSSVYPNLPSHPAEPHGSNPSNAISYL